MRNEGGDGQAMGRRAEGEEERERKKVERARTMQPYGERERERERGRLDPAYSCPAAYLTPHESLACVECI